MSSHLRHGKKLSLLLKNNKKGSITRKKPEELRHLLFFFSFMTYGTVVGLSVHITPSFFSFFFFFVALDDSLMCAWVWWRPYKRPSYLYLSRLLIFFFFPVGLFLSYMCLLWYGSSMWDVDNNNLWPPSRFLPRRLSGLSVPCPSSRAINIYDQTTHIHNRGASSPSKMTIYVSGPLSLSFFLTRSYQCRNRFIGTVILLSVFFLYFQSMFFSLFLDA